MFQYNAYVEAGVRPVVGCCVSSASGRKVQIAPDIWSEIWSGLESDSCALYFTETGWAQGPLQ